MVNILGINTHHAGSSAAVVINGDVISAVAEERLNRVKYYAGFPKLAIRTVIDMSGIDFKDLDYVAIGRDAEANRNKKIEYVLKNPTKLLNFMQMRSSKQDLSDIRSLLVSECGADENDLNFEQVNVEHHIAHIASAYYISPWKHAAGFSIDGSGDFVTCMLAECRGKEIDVKHRIYVPHSLGTLYNMVCQFIGYDRYGDEGKVMGLAPYGDETYCDHFMDMISTTSDGFTLNPDYFMPFGSTQGIRMTDEGTMVIERLYSNKMIELFGEPRKRGTEITQRDMNLAYALQSRFEDIYMHMLNVLHDIVPAERVAMAGGAVLNSVANGKLFDHTPFKETCIQPAAGDEGLSMGAALYVSQNVEKAERFVMQNAYFGPAFTDEQMRSALEDAGLDYQECDREVLLDTAAAAIEDSKIVGWFQGGSEWGPRALGNRSILAHPGRDDMKEILNARIKHREWFRPFAPVVLEEHQSTIFEKDYPSPYMLHVYKIRPEWREKLPAVNHVDNTGRLQSVSRDENPMYYDLIQAFYKRTGIPVLINTSFNENEPIVNTPDEAVDCFMRTNMDVLVMGSHFVKKTSN